MGDGKVQRFAMIIHGGRYESRDYDVDKAAEHLSESGYDIYFASDQKPNLDNIKLHASFDSVGVDKVADAVLEAGIDDDDELLILTHTHGTKDTICLKDGCVRNDIDAFKKLLSIQHGKRTIILNQCYDGSWIRAASGPRTLFISSGTEDEITSDHDLIHTIIRPDKEITDADKNGTITWQERFRQARLNGWGATNIFLAGREYKDTGIDGTIPEPPHFSATLNRVNNTEDYEKIMANLKPGDFAVVAVNPSAEDAQRLEQLAKTSEGRALFVSVSGLSPEEQKSIDLPNFPAVYAVDFRGLKAKVTNSEDPLSDRSKIYDDIVPQRAYWAEGMAFHPKLTIHRLPAKYAHDPYFNSEVAKKKTQRMMPFWLRRKAAIPSFRVHLLDPSLVGFWNIGAPDHSISGRGVGASLGFSWSPLRFGTEYVSSLGIYAGSTATFSDITHENYLHSENTSFLHTALKFGVLAETMISDNFFLGAMPYISETHVNVEKSSWRAEEGQNYEKEGPKTIYSGSERAWGIDFSLRLFKLREVTSFNFGIGYERIGSLRDGGNMVRISIAPHLSF